MSDTHSTTSLKDEVARLKSATDEYEAAKSQLDENRKQFELDNAELIDRVNHLSHSVNECKSGVRGAAAAEYYRTGNKKLAGGIGIREKTELRYDDGEAFKFAMQKGMFLSLDKKAFEKAAPSLQLSFIEIEKVPQVTFPKQIEL